MKYKETGIVKAGLGIIIGLTVLILTGTAAVYAETTILPTDNEQAKRVSVDMPVLDSGDSSPFNFIIDPLTLIYATDAEKYGGGVVEEGATVLFRNHVGSYDFSSCSDKLRIRNRNVAPVEVMITATIENLGDIAVVPRNAFSNTNECEMYMALVDDKGNEVPIDQDGTAVLKFEMNGAPDNAYAYRYNPETNSYDYELTTDVDSIAWDTYSFGIKASCNPDGNWFDISCQPCINGTWSIGDMSSNANTDMSISENSISEETEESDQSSEEEDIVVSGPVPADDVIVEDDSADDVIMHDEDKAADNIESISRDYIDQLTLISDDSVSDSNVDSVSVSDNAVAGE